MFSVIVPMLNEPETETILGQIRDALADLPDSYEVIVVTGDKEKVPFKLPAVKNTRHVVTYGDSLERSILNGFSHARGDKIAVMDADGSHPPANLPLMWLELESCEMVVGSRFVNGAEFAASPTRSLVTWAFHVAASQAGSRLRDPTSGFFAIRREVLDRCRFKPLTWKTALEIELRAHPKVKEIPILFRERSVGESHAGAGVGLRLLWQLQWEGWT